MLSLQHFNVARHRPREELRTVLSHHAVLAWDLGEREGFTPMALDKLGSSIVWDKHGIMFHGPKTELYAYHMHGKGRIYGIEFSAAGAKVLIDRSMREPLNEIVPVQKAISGWSAFIGIDPIDAADQFRIFEAIQALEAGAGPDLAAHAYDLGCSSQSHFSNQFRKMAKTSPGQYVRLNREVERS
jgi:AraC-like DNA-binding protein